MKIKDISKYLNIPLVLVTGFARAGFFGFSSKSGHFTNEAIQAYKKYGLQWNPKLQERSVPENIEPIIAGWENPPLHTLTEYAISIDKDPDAIENLYWVANFFFIPNNFYFHDDAILCRAKSPKVKLKEKVTFSDENEKNVAIYPNPNGNLALIQVIGKIDKNTDENLFTVAKDAIVPVLNWLSFTTDHILPIVQQNLIKLPSGDIHFYKTKQAPLVELNPSNFIEHKPLRDALSLYRISLNLNEPMYVFLSFFRASEAIEKVKKEWFNKYRERFKECQEFITLINDFNKLSLPNHLVFGEFSQRKFTYTLDKLKNKYRNAIAHSHNDKKEIDVYLLTGSDEEANIYLQTSLSSIRYIVRIQIEKIIAIFDLVKQIDKQI